MSQVTANQMQIIVVILAVIVIVTVLLDAGLFVAWAVRKEDVDSGIRPPLFARRWSLVDVWIAGQAIMVILIGAVTVGGFIYLVSGSSGKAMSPERMMSSPPFMLYMFIVQNALLFGVPALFIKLKYRLPLADIGLPTIPRPRSVMIGLGFGIAFLGFAFLLDKALPPLISLAFGPEVTKKLADLTQALTVEGMIKGKMSVALFATLLFSAGIAAPIGEEMFFRGFLYNCAKRRLGIGGGVALSAIIFALIHAGPLAVIAIIFMGVALAIAYEKTGSLWVTIIMHAVNNCVAITYMFVVNRMQYH